MTDPLRDAAERTAREPAAPGATMTDQFEDAILRNTEQIAKCHGLDARHILLIQSVRELHELASRFRLHRHRLIQAANKVIHRDGSKEELNGVVGEVTGHL